MREAQSLWLNSSQRLLVIGCHLNLSFLSNTMIKACTAGVRGQGNSKKWSQCSMKEIYLKPFFLFFMKWSIVATSLIASMPDNFIRKSHHII